MIKKNYYIFKAIKSHIESNSNYIARLFPESKRVGDNIYFDAPSYNSWSFNITKMIGRDFRTDDRAIDIIGTYQKYYNIARPIEAAKAVAEKLNLNTRGLSYGR